MALLRILQTDAEPAPALHARAMDNLRFIRETMERAASFTAVPGWGGVLMGITALGAALVAARQPATTWLVTWLAEALLACLIGTWAVSRKAHAAKMPLFSGPGRNFALSFFSPMLVGALLTVVLYRAGLANVLAALNAGARAFDASLGGLGGCPYAPGATGNIVTEDLAFMLEAMGFEIGIDLARLIAVRELVHGLLPEVEQHGAIAKAGLPKNFHPVQMAQAAE